MIRLLAAMVTLLVASVLVAQAAGMTVDAGVLQTFTVEGPALTAGVAEEADGGALTALSAKGSGPGSEIVELSIVVHEYDEDHVATRSRRWGTYEIPAGVSYLVDYDLEARPCPDDVSEGLPQTGGPFESSGAASHVICGLEGGQPRVTLESSDGTVVEPGAEPSLLPTVSPGPEQSDPPQEEPANGKSGTGGGDEERETSERVDGEVEPEMTRAGGGGGAAASDPCAAEDAGSEPCQVETRGRTGP